VKQFFMLVVTAMMIPFALGQSATFTNNVLTVPGVGVVDGDTSSFYADVELSYEGDGMFRITEAQDRSLVAIEEISVSILESFPVQVSVNVDGYKSVPCVELLEPAVTRDGNNFTVILAESQLGPADEQQTCIALLTHLPPVSAWMSWVLAPAHITSRSMTSLLTSRWKQITCHRLISSS